MVLPEFPGDGYNVAEAAKALQKLTTTEHQFRLRKQVSFYRDHATLATLESRHSVGVPQCHRLTKLTKNGESTEEEVVFHLQGVITAANLPPVQVPRTRGSHQKRKPDHLVQSVNVTGFGISQFNESVEAVSALHSMVSRDFPEGALEEWAPSDFNGFPVVSLANRIFTPCDPRETHQSVPFTLLEDPKWHLKKMSSSSLRHLADNVVEYLKRVSDGDKRTLLSYNPASFRRGDLIDVAFSIVVVPLRGRSKYKMKLLLRSVILLEPGFTNRAALHSSIASVGLVPSASTPLKRKASEELEDIEPRADKHPDPSS